MTTVSVHYLPTSPFAFKEASQRQSCTKVHHSSAAGMSCEAQVLHHRNASWWFPKLVCAAVGLLPVGLIALLPSIKIETTIPVVQDSVGGGLPAVWDWSSRQFCGSRTRERLANPVGSRKVPYPLTTQDRY
uniref:Uncharacterized protein n=1 Tax=Micrurus paraensis TaxID=1970185 RepID=A0A2D4K8L1_9SAUR